MQDLIEFLVALVESVTPSRTTLALPVASALVSVVVLSSRARRVDARLRTPWLARLSAMPRAAVLLLAAAFSIAPSLAAPPPSEDEARERVKTLMVPSPYRIPDRALSGKIRYEFTFAEGAGVSLPETGEQHVERKDERFVVTICGSGCGRETAPDEAELDRYLKPNRWVQSRDRKIVNFAKISPLIEPVRIRMPLLVRAVVERLGAGRIEYSHYYSALEAFEKQEGDCTESAVLLAAAARSRGIPTRVVAGLAYGSRFLGRQHVFGPHMWVQSWNGERWVSYDAGMLEFDAGHIALVVGDGTPDDFQAAIETIHRLRIVSAVGLVPNESGTVGSPVQSP